MQQDNDPEDKCSGVTVLYNIFDWPSQSHDLNPSRRVVLMLKSTVKEEIRQNRIEE